MEQEESSTQETKVLRFVCISDTHTMHEEVDIPEGDVLLHAGDFTALGPMKQTKEFNEWLGTLPHKYKVVVAGNHEIAIDKMKVKRIEEMFTNATYLQDTWVTLPEGVKIWGAPWVIKKRTYLLAPVKFVLAKPIPAFNVRGNGLAHAYPAESKGLKKKWDKIPGDIDILLTHSPPQGVLDINPRSGHHQGCRYLREAVMRIKPAVHCFGHVHAQHGTHRNEDTRTLFINAANFLHHRTAIVFDLDLDTREATLVSWEGMDKTLDSISDDDDDEEEEEEDAEYSLSEQPKKKRKRKKKQKQLEPKVKEESSDQEQAERGHSEAEEDQAQFEISSSGE